jgi:hypothetical protein
MQPITYELKYCERCGALRLRRSESPETYCQPCEQVLFSLPLPDGARPSKLLLRKPRTPKDELRVFKTEAQLEPPYGRLQ